MVATPTIEWNFSCIKRASTATIPNIITPGTYDLTNHGPVSLVKSPDLYCYIFNGVDDYLEDGAVFALSATSFTIEFFIEIDTTQTAYGDVVNRFGADASGWGVFYNATTNTLELWAAANVVATTKIDYTPGQRVHGVVTYDNASHTTNWYIDGNIDKTDATTTLTVVNTSNLTVGRDSGAGGTNPFKGGVFFIRVYNNVVLSAADARTRYLASAAYYVEFSFVNTPLTAPTYRMWARNYDYTLRQPVWKWNTMDMSLKYCDVSTCVITMQTSDYLEAWYDATYTPVTERTWTQNRTNGGAGGSNWRFLKGTGIVIWRNDDTYPLFHGMISGFKRNKRADGSDTCEITFSSDELLLQEHIAFPDILVGDNQRSGQLMPNSNGIWGYTGYGDGDWGSQWATDYMELADSQEAQMKYFVQDQIGALAPAIAVTNRKLSILKVQPLWNSSDAGATGGYGDDTLLTDILESLLDLCKFCVVPQPASDATVYAPDKEIQFFIRYHTPPDGAYYLEFCTQTATNTVQRLALAGVAGSEGPGNRPDVAMGEHDKRLTCVFSELTGTVVELEYEELRPELNQSFVIGPTPNADKYASTSTPTGNAVSNVVTGVDFGNMRTDVYPIPFNWDVATTTETAVTTDVDHRLYKLVTGEPVALSQDVYGVIEGTFEHSTGEGMADAGNTSTQKTLKMMKFAGRSDINEKVFNIWYKATVKENDVLKMSPDNSMQNFFIGDYVKVITDYGNIENLVREIHLSADSLGEKLETIIGTPSAAYGNWWTAGAHAKEARHHARRTSRHHYHRSR
jgi:hypothetical protein